MPIHLRAEPSDYAPAVLVPGDPKRATYIAERIFDPGARLVNDERGELGYTGTYQGTPISVQSVGMGGASVAIYYTELHQLGARRVIRVGTAGGLPGRVRMGDTIVAVSATCDDPIGKVLTDGEEHAPTADFRLVELAARVAREKGANVHVGPIVTSPLFYDHRRGIMKRWSERGHLAVEMEAAVLYILGAQLGFEALCICTVSDMIEETGESERIDDDDLRTGVDRMMAVACEVAVADL